MKDSGSAALRFGIAVAVLAAAYLGMAWFLGRHIPANTTVAGVPIGGMSPASAEYTLRRALACQERAKVTLTGGDKPFELDPKTAGLAIDYAGTVDELWGFSVKPSDIWNNLTAGPTSSSQTPSTGPGSRPRSRAPRRPSTPRWPQGSGHLPGGQGHGRRARHRGRRSRWRRPPTR